HLLTDRHAGDAQLIAPPEIRLHQNADRVSAGLLIEPARCRADAALEAITDHAGAAANIAFADGTALCRIERVKDVLRLDVKAVDIVEIAVPGLSDHRQRPPVTG